MTEQVGVTVLPTFTQKLRSYAMALRNNYLKLSAGEAEFIAEALEQSAVRLERSALPTEVCAGCRRGLPFNKFGHHFELIPDTGTMPCANDPRRAARPEVDALDAARYRFLQRRACGNAEGGKGSDEECYLSLNPRDMDAAIDSHLADEARRSPQKE